MRMRSTIARTKARGGQSNTQNTRSSNMNRQGGQNPQQFYFKPPKDPNAMDIDFMSTEERADYIKKGLCFKCRQPGHRANDPTFHPKQHDWEGISCPRQDLDGTNGWPREGRLLSGCIEGGFLIRRTESTSVSPYIDIYSVITAMISLNKLSIPIQIKTNTEKRTVETLALIDSGARGQFIDQNYVKKGKFEIHQLPTTIQAFNVDSTENKRGTIKMYVDLELEINGRKTKTQLLIMGLGKEWIILGFPWLNQQNPGINWKTGEVAWCKTEERRFFFNDKNLSPQELRRCLEKRQ